jgi:hypothetical protein
MSRHLCAWLIFDVGHMKYLSSILAGITAILIAACIFEYGARGLNPPIESDWVMHPAWWQSDILADLGMYIRVISVQSFSFVVHKFAPSDQDSEFRYIYWMQYIFAALGYVIVFYAMKLSAYLDRRDEEGLRQPSNLASNEIAKEK